MGKALLLLNAAFYQALGLFMLELIAAGHLQAKCLGPPERPDSRFAARQPKEPDYEGANRFCRELQLARHGNSSLRPAHR
jgi:hypothetical protein